jgi:hypothetical protein
MAVFDGAFSDVLEVDLLKLITGQNTSGGPLGTLTAPSTWALSLHTGEVTDDNVAPTEVTNANGYVRIASTGKWGAPSAGGSVTTTSTCRWPVSGTATASWGTIVGVGLWAGATATTYGSGQFVAWMPMAVDVEVPNLGAMTITAGGLTLSLGGATNPT